MPTLPLSSGLSQETPEYLAKQNVKAIPEYTPAQARSARYRLGDMNDSVSNLSDLVSSHLLQEQGKQYSPEELKTYFPESTVDIKYPVTIDEFTRIDKRKKELDKIARIDEYSPQSSMNSMLKFGAEMAGGLSTLDLAVSMGVGAVAGVMGPVAKYAASHPKLFSFASNIVENLAVEPTLNAPAHKVNHEDYGVNYEANYSECDKGHTKT